MSPLPDSQSFVSELISNGRWSFDFAYVRSVFGEQAANRVSHMLRSGRLVSPARGFYVIVPEEMMRHRHLDPKRFIHAMMQHLQVPYYVGLLSAADIYGVAPQAVMKMQILTYPARRKILKREYGLLFYQKNNISSMPLSQGKSYTGYFNVSTPAGTLFDLITYYKHVGGMDYIYEILEQLGEIIKLRDLRQVFPHFPSVILQRGGYLMERAGWHKAANAVAQYLSNQSVRYTYLSPTDDKKILMTNERWHVHINEELTEY